MATVTTPASGFHEGYFALGSDGVIYLDTASGAIPMTTSALSSVTLTPIGRDWFRYDNSTAYILPPTSPETVGDNYFEGRVPGTYHGNSSTMFIGLGIGFARAVSGSSVSGITAVLSNPNVPFNAAALINAVSENDGVYSMALAESVAEGVINPSAFTAAPIYVDHTSGSNTNNGSSWAQAVKSIAKGRELGEATGSPYRLVLRENQTWLRSQTFAATSSYVQDYVVQVENDGEATVALWDALTYAPDGTYPALYKATRSSVLRVVDPSNLDADGLPAEYASYASAAALDAAGAVNGWAQSGSDLFVRRADAAAVTNSNCGALIAVTGYQQTAACNSWIEGLTFIGGTNGAIYQSFTGTGNLVTKRTKAIFPGSTGTPRDAVRLRNFNGMHISFDDMAACSIKDGFNIHVDTGSNATGGLYINPVTRRIGHATASSSNNAFTLHETARAVVLNPDFEESVNGSTVANVGDSRCIIFGGTIRADDLINGVGKFAVETAHSAITWLVGCTVIGDLGASGTSAIYYRDITHTGSIVTVDSGVVEPF